MEVMLEKIRNKLLNGKEVYISKTTFVSFLQESSMICAWDNCGLMIVFENGSRLFCRFCIIKEHFVQIVQVELSKADSSNVA